MVIYYDKKFLKLTTPCTCSSLRIAMIGALALQKAISKTQMSIIKIIPLTGYSVTALHAKLPSR